MGGPRRTLMSTKALANTLSRNRPALMSDPRTRVLRVPSVLRCGLLICGLKLALKIRGVAWTVRWIRRRVEAVPADALVDPTVVRDLDYAVAMAAAFYPGRALCLEQSLVLYYLLRRQGVPAKYRQGVQPHPFAAHAWVEYRGELINDVPEHAKWFVPLPDQLP